MSDLLSYETILAATASDSRAICMVLKHYETYIKKMSFFPAIGADGAYCLRLNEDAEQEMKIHLITKLPQFDPCLDYLSKSVSP